MAEKHTMWTVVDGGDKEALKAALKLEGYCLSKRKEKCNGCVFYLAFDEACPLESEPGDSEISEAIYNSSVALYDKEKNRRLML